LEKRVRDKIERGDYDNADALMQEAVHRLLEEEETNLESIRQRLRQADAEIDRGEGSDFDERTTSDLAREIHARGMQRLAGLPKAGTRG
jgi:Arc/MetJ-type ribon-helix-helix transcriptional regulator